LHRSMHHGGNSLDSNRGGGHGCLS
jgi:hypothetical protein